VTSCAVEHGSAVDAAVRTRRLLVAGGFVLSLVLFFVVYRPWDLANAFMIGAPFGRDFANFWAGGHLALTGRFDLLVDFTGYNDFIATTFHHDPTDQLVFSYPPILLPFLVPFGALPFGLAVLVWTVLNVALIERSARLLADHDRACRVAACISPATVTMVAYGHFGGALALLGTYAVTHAAKRPRIAGLCLALMSVKPQFAVSLGVLLLIAGRWRAVLWSLPVTLGLVGLSLAMFGLKPWVNFLEWTLPFQTQLVTHYAPEVLKRTASLYAAASLLGLPEWIGYGLHFGVAAVVLIGSATLLRRVGATPRIVALALLSVLIALPYLHNYDLAVAGPAVAVALFAGKPGESRPFLSIVPATLLWLVPTFSLSFDMLAMPVTPLVVAGALLTALCGETIRFATASGRLICPPALRPRLPPNEARTS